MSSAVMLIYALSSVSGAVSFKDVPAHVVYGYPSEKALAEQCVIAAAAKYQVPSDILKALLKQEAGYRGASVKNKNRTRDYGYAQTNSIHLPELARYGVTKEKLMYDPCVSIGTMAWMVAKHLAAAPRGPDGKISAMDYWKAIGNYHSKTPSLNKKYRESVWYHLQEIRGSYGSSTN